MSHSSTSCSDTTYLEVNDNSLLAQKPKDTVDMAIKESSITTCNQVTNTGSAVQCRRGLVLLLFGKWYKLHSAEQTKFSERVRMKLVFPGCASAFVARQDNDSLDGSLMHASNFVDFVEEEFKKDEPDLRGFHYQLDPYSTPIDFLERFTADLCTHVRHRSGLWFEQKYQACENNHEFGRREATSLGQFQRPFPGTYLEGAGWRDTDLDDNTPSTEAFQFDLAEWVDGISKEFGGYTMGKRGELVWDETEQAFVCELQPSEGPNAHSDCGASTMSVVS